MTSVIAQTFEKTRKLGRAAFMPFMTAGFPGPSTFMEIIQVLDQNGADLIEIGLPFSDPLADGPTIQKAGQIALENGLTPPAVLDLAAQARARIKSPLVLMSYWNPILQMGPGAFAAGARDSGLAGVIVPDLPPEEAEAWIEAARSCGLDTVFMVAPTTTARRRRKILAVARGFIYYVSLTGVTGSAFAVTDELLNDIGSLRRDASLPVAVGFGVSGPVEARALASVADGVIVGSALVRRVFTKDKPAEQTAAVAELAAAIKAALGPTRSKS